MNSSIFPAFGWLVYLIVTQSFLSPDVHTVINASMSILYFIMAITLITKLETKQVIRVADFMFWVSIPLLVVESFYRITHPVFLIDTTGGSAVEVEDAGIYPFKFSSIMYQDSNFVGIFIICLFFLAYYIYNYVEARKIYVYIMLLLFILILLTLARAAISSTVVFFLFFFISKRIGFYRTVFIFGLIGILFKLLFLQSVEEDGSLQSKFMIIERTASFIEKAPLNEIVFGVGIGNTVKYLGIGAHNFFVTYIVETGFLGLTILMFFWGYLVYCSKGKVLYVMLPFLVAGMSLAGHAIPFLYTVFAIIIKLSRDNNIIYDKIQQTHSSRN
nr:hypothetical protein [uncultured Pedobacter sp.]